MEVELHERQCEFVHRMFEVSEFAPVFKRLLGGNNDRNESHTAHVIYDSQFVCEARVVVVPSVSRRLACPVPRSAAAHIVDSMDGVGAKCHWCATGLSQVQVPR